MPAQPKAKESKVKTQPADNTQSLPLFATNKLSDVLAGQRETQKYCHNLLILLSPINLNIRQLILMPPITDPKHT